MALTPTPHKWECPHMGRPMSAEANRSSPDERGQRREGPGRNSKYQRPLRSGVNRHGPACGTRWTPRSRPEGNATARGPARAAAAEGPAVRGGGWVQSPRWDAGGTPHRDWWGSAQFSIRFG